MSFNVNDFKSRLVDGGARANLFRVTFTAPAVAGLNNETASFLCRSAGIPASVISPVEVPYRGRIVKFAGDRTFEPWTVTMYNDAGFTLRAAFERWQSEIENHAAATGNPAWDDYSAELDVVHLSKKGDPIRRYRFYNAFPTNIAQIDLTYDQQTTIEEYTVEFQYDYWLANELAPGVDGVNLVNAPPLTA